MTREEAKDYIREWCPYDRQEEIIKALEQEPCEDCISRQAVLDMLEDINAETEGVGFYYEHYVKYIKDLPSVTPKEKTKHCKDCKWWKDNDGVYRRGVNAESNCPINSRTVYEGNGYCFMFEPQESEVQK